MFAFGNAFGVSFGFSFGAIQVDSSGLRISYFDKPIRIDFIDDMSRDWLIDQLDRYISTDHDRSVMIDMIDRIMMTRSQPRQSAAQSNRTSATNQQDRQ